jgi:predicted lipid-binding transport protein (Tim44 family)
MTQEEVNVLVLFVLLGFVWSVAKSAIEKITSQYNNPNHSAFPPTALASRQAEAICADDVRSLTWAPSGANADVARDLELIRRVDPTFDVRKFLDGGRLVYEAVVMAFAKGDRDLLRELASEEVYAEFLDVIEQRERRNERVELEFIQIEEARIFGISLFNTQAQITIGFAAQLVTATRGEYGAVVCGDPNGVLHVSELWSFACDLSSRKPAWKLIATGAA